MPCVCVRVCVRRAAAPSMSIKMLIIHLSYHIQYKSYQFWNEPYNLQICITHAYSLRSRARARESAKEIERVVYGRERASVREKHRKKRRERPRAREGKTCLTPASSTAPSLHFAPSTRCGSFCTAF